MCEPQAPPAESSSHMRPLRSKAVRSPSPPELGLGRGCFSLEKLSQNGAMPGAGCGGRSYSRKPWCPKSPGRSQRSRVELPARPRTPWAGAARGAGVLGRWPGGRGGQSLQFFKEEASGGLVSGRVEGAHGSRVRRRIPPVWWASGRPLRWLVSAPPRSSCLHPSSSCGTA